MSQEQVAALITEHVVIDIYRDAATVTAGASFEYDVADPYAVSFIPEGPEPVRWTFSRDLLIDGFHEPTGVGDVEVFPCLDSQGNAVVVLGLRAPDACADVQVSARSIADFLRASLHLVPRGSESEHVDLDAAVLEVLRPSL